MKTTRRQSATLIFVVLLTGFFVLATYFTLSPGGPTASGPAEAEDIGPPSNPTLVIQRGDNDVTWKLFSYSGEDGSCLDVLGSIQSQAIGGPGGCGGFDPVTEQLLAQLPPSPTLPSWAVSSPPAVRDLVQGGVVAEGTPVATKYWVLGGLLNCDCTAHVVWPDGATTDSATTGGFFIAWHETSSELSVDDQAVVTAVAG
jgi:hypothetical protein